MDEGSGVQKYISRSTGTPRNCLKPSFLFNSGNGIILIIDRKIFIYEISFFFFFLKSFDQTKNTHKLFLRHNDFALPLLESENF